MSEPMAHVMETRTLTRNGASDSWIDGDYPFDEAKKHAEDVAVAQGHERSTLHWEQTSATAWILKAGEVWTNLTVWLTPEPPKGETK